MTDQERFGRRLKQLRREKAAREERDVEQEEVATAIGDVQPNLARWERGRIPKEDETVRKLAAYYGVTFIWLRHGEGAREAPPALVPEPDTRAKPSRPARASSAK